MGRGGIGITLRNKCQLDKVPRYSWGKLGGWWVIQEEEEWTWIARCGTEADASMKFICYDIDFHCTVTVESIDLSISTSIPCAYPQH